MPRGHDTIANRKNIRCQAGDCRGLGQEKQVVIVEIEILRGQSGAELGLDVGGKRRKTSPFEKTDSEKK